MDDLLEHTRTTTDTVVGLLGAFDTRGLTISDDTLLTLLGRAEDLGRAADALRALVTAEVSDRSRPELGPESLAHQRGCATTTELIERITRVSSATARARLRLGTRIHRCTGFTGTPLPAAFDAVRTGLVTGTLSLDSAHTITHTLTLAGRGTPTNMLGGLHAAEHELVAAATGTSPAPGTPALPPATHTETKLQAATWAEVLNPDGTEPTERQFDARHFRLLPARNGWVPVTGLLAPEVAGQIQRVFDTLTNPRQVGALPYPGQTGTGSPDEDGDTGFGPSASTGSSSGSSGDDDDAIRDPRTRPQRHHDALATVFEIIGRTDQLPTLGGASATILVTTLTTDFTNGHGAGHIDGLDTPIPMTAVRQHACANGIHTLTLTASGAIHSLETTQRTFTRAQRRALAARDGGCIIPDCPVPAWATEAHHVTEWWAGGQTTIDNGVLLCWYHHRTIEKSGWQIRMIRGVPHVKPPPWLGNPVWRTTTTSPTRRKAELQQRYSPANPYD